MTVKVCPGGQMRLPYKPGTRRMQSQAQCWG
jgi:hypothetical protein